MGTLRFGISLDDKVALKLRIAKEFARQLEADFRRVAENIELVERQGQTHRQ